MPTMNVLTDEGFDVFELSELASTVRPILDIEDAKFDEDSIVFNYKKVKVELAGDLTNFDPFDPEGRIDSITIFQEKQPVLELVGLKFGLGKIVLALVADPGAFLEAFLLKGFRPEDQYEVNGGQGGDVLLAGPGKYFGNDGNDVLIALGEAKFNGGDGANDAVSYELFKPKTADGVTASLADQRVNTGEAAGDTYVSIERLIGSIRNDTLIGDDKANLLSGDNGFDTLEGGKGGDTLDGGNGTDFASYEGSLAVGGDFETGVRASLAIDRGYSGDAKGDRYVSIEGLIGSDRNDSLVGGGGGDQILGAVGNDTVSGGKDDQLWGDSTAFGVDGDDTFLLRNIGDASLSIMDFDVFDKVAIKRKTFDLDKDFTFEDGVNFISADDPVATGAEPIFLFDRGVEGADFKFRGELFFDADGAGGEAARLVARMTFDSQEYLDIFDVTVV